MNDTLILVSLLGLVGLFLGPGYNGGGRRAGDKPPCWV